MVWKKFSRHAEAFKLDLGAMSSKLGPSLRRYKGYQRETGGHMSDSVPHSLAPRVVGALL